MLMRMACIKCRRKKAAFPLPHLPGKICSDCFLKIIEKRVRKVARIAGYFRKNDKILFLDDGTANSQISKYFLEKLTTHAGITLIEHKIADINKIIDSKIPALIKKHKANKAVVPWNADQEAEYILSKLISSGCRERDPAELMPIKHILEKEIDLFAKLKGFSKKKPKPFNKHIKVMLDSLEKEHPEIRFALIKSMEKIKRK